MQVEKTHTHTHTHCTCVCSLSFLELFGSFFLLSQLFVLFYRAVSTSSTLPLLLLLFIYSSLPLSSSSYISLNCYFVLGFWWLGAFVLSSSAQPPVRATFYRYKNTYTHIQNTRYGCGFVAVLIVI